MLLDGSKDIGLAANTGKTKFMELGRRRSMMANKHIVVDKNSYKKVKTFKCLSFLSTNQNSIHEETKFIFKLGNSVIIQSKHFCLLDFSPKMLNT